MKKQIALLLAALLLVSMTACGNGSTNETTEPNGTKEPVGTTAAPETTEPNGTKEPVGTTAAPETTVPDAPILGITEGNTYTNEFFGMTCTMNEGWIVANEEQLAQIMGVTADALTEANLDSSGTAYSMYASSSDGLSTVNIVMENLGLVYGMLMDAKTYAETSSGQLAPAMESLGLTDVTTQVTTVTFAGREETAIRLSANLSGIPFYETLVCLKQGSYIAVVTAASYYEDTTDQILANFQAA